MSKISNLMDGIRSEIPDFSENHYDNSYAGKEWERLIKSFGIENKVDKLRNELVDECNKELSEITRELKLELSIVAELSIDRHIKMNSIFDSKRAWNWVTNTLAGGIGIAAIAFASNPLGWAAAAVGAVGFLFSWFFDDREEKARREREKLSRRLYNNIAKIESNQKKKAGDWFYQELLKNKIYVLLYDLGAVTDGLFKLADTQRSLAWTLNDRQKDLGNILVNKVLDQLDSAYLREHIVDVARVPGSATMLLISPNGSVAQIV